MLIQFPSTTKTTSLMTAQRSSVAAEQWNVDGKAKEGDTKAQTLTGTSSNSKNLDQKEQTGKTAPDDRANERQTKGCSSNNAPRDSTDDRHITSTTAASSSSSSSGESSNFESLVFVFDVRAVLIPVFDNDSDSKY